MDKIDYRYEIECLKDFVSKCTYEQFVSDRLFYNCIIEDTDEIMDFDFEHLTATIYKQGDRCYITGVYDCFDDDGQWVDTLYGEIIYF